MLQSAFVPRRLIRLRTLPMVIALFVAPTIPLRAFARLGLHSKPQQIIVSPTRPTDSRGEVVYENQGKLQRNIPVVPGVYKDPVPLRRGRLVFPASQRMTTGPVTVTIEGVIANDGALIDVSVPHAEHIDPAFIANAIQDAAEYRFKPATLDGKPVAILMQIVMTFNTFGR